MRRRSDAAVSLVMIKVHIQRPRTFLCQVLRRSKQRLLVRSPLHVLEKKMNTSNKHSTKLLSRRLGGATQ